MSLCQKLLIIEFGSKKIIKKIFFIAGQIYPTLNQLFKKFCDRLALCLWVFHIAQTGKFHFKEERS